MSHKSHMKVELICLGVIIGSGIAAASFHGTRILAQHNDVVYAQPHSSRFAALTMSSVSKSARYQQFTRPSPLYVDHEEALANRKKLYSVQEGTEN